MRNLEFRASNAHRWAECTASVKEVIKYPIPPSSEAAKQGTLAHEYFAFAVDYVLAKGKRIKSKPDNQMANYAIKAVIQLEKFIIESKKKPVTFLIERKQNINFLQTENQTCTPDLAIIFDDYSYLIADYKYGTGIKVNVNDNPQLMFYANVVREKLNTNDNLKGYAAILQPRIYGEKFSFTEFDDAVLNKFKLKFQGAEREALSENPKYKIGDWCKFCPAENSCPAHQKMIQQSFTDLSVLNPDISANISTNISSIVDKPVSEFSNQELAKLIDAKNKLQNFLKEIDKEVFKRLNEGQKIDGYKLVAKRAIRRWSNENELIDFLQNELKYGYEIFESKLLSPNKLQKVLGKKDYEKIKNYITQVSSGVTMVPESDKREAITSISLEFDNIENET